MSDRPCIIDACCLINVLTVDDSLATIRSSFRKLYVARAVVDEVKYVLVDGDEDPGLPQCKPVDLSALIETGGLTVCEPDGAEELNAYVEFARALEDGEAMSLAIALKRGLTIATDDRKARRIASDSEVSTTSTAELLYAWAEAEPTANPTLKDMVERIRRLARFVPAADMPRASEWLRLLDS